MKMYGKIICGMMAAGMAAVCFTSCGKTDVLNDYYRYDLAEYVRLPEYKGLEAAGMENILTEERIQAEILAPLYYYTQKSIVTDRESRIGDIAIVSYVGFCGGERTETMSKKELVLGEGTMAAEFENALVGHRAGDDIKVSLAYPEDYGIAEYAGQTVEYTVSLDAIYEEKIPKYTDDFVRGYLGYDSIAEYESEVRSNLEEYYAELTSFYVINQLWPEISENTEVLQYPEKELQAYYNDTVDAHKELAKENDITFTDYVSDYFSMTVDEFYESMMEEAKATVKDELICYTIARAENITLTDAEYEERAEEYAEQYEMESVEDLEEKYGKDTIMRLLLCDKVQEWVAAEANLTETADSVVTGQN